METDLHELADVATALDWLNTPEMARNVRHAIAEIDRLREELRDLKANHKAPRAAAAAATIARP